MIVAAFAAIAAAYPTTSLTIGVLAGIASAMALAALLAVFNLRFKANIFIADIAVTFMAYGLTALLLKGLLGQEGVFSSDRIPVFPPAATTSQVTLPGAAAGGGATSSRRATATAPTTPVNCVRAPAASATGVRDELLLIGNPWKNPAARFAAPRPIIS
jgi:ABC-type uncharacterized transport system permease subunit